MPADRMGPNAARHRQRTPLAHLAAGGSPELEPIVAASLDLIKHPELEMLILRLEHERHERVCSRNRKPR